MDYFFDNTSGVNFGGDFEFAPQTTGNSNMSLPDFTNPSMDPSHQNPFQTVLPDFSNPVGAGNAPVSFYGSTDSHYSHTLDPSSFMTASQMPPSQAPSKHLSSDVKLESPSIHFHDPTSSTQCQSTMGQVQPTHSQTAEPETASVSQEATSSSSNSDSIASSSTSAPPIETNQDSNTSASEPSNSNHSAEQHASTTKETSVDSDASEEPTIDINVNNVVCAFSVRCHLNLRKVALEGCNTEYNRQRAMVSMKLRKPKITASIWNSGKITCIGATSEADAKKGARRIARILMTQGFKVHFCRFRVVNVLATCTMPFAIRLHKFSEKYSKETEYEPELHPGATYKIKNPKAVLKVFSTGSITITAPHVSHISSAVEHIYPRVMEFRMDEKEKEPGGEMATLVPQAFVPLNTKHGRAKLIPKGPYHSKFKQVIHQQGLVKKAIQQVKDNEDSDEEPMYMGYDSDEDEAEYC